MESHVDGFRGTQRAGTGRSVSRNGAIRLGAIYCNSSLVQERGLIGFEVGNTVELT